MANKFFHNPKNVAIQLMNLKYKYQSTNYYLKKGNLYWEQQVKPSEISREYTITVKYNGINPEVYLYNQGIMKSKEDNIPHCYKQFYKDENNEYVKICLFYPKYREWSSDMFISDTIIPWTIDWLYYYELWLITGKWLGGGKEHGKR